MKPKITGIDILKNDLPKDTPFDSVTFQTTVLYSGGLFFFDGVQTELSDSEINDLHSDYMLLEMQELNEFKEGCYYQLNPA